MKNNFGGRQWLLFILPLYILCLAIFYFLRLTPFYQHQPDPCYAYLFNGMNLAGGKMEIGHIDHPGTTVQCLAAIIIFIKHLCTAPGTQLYQDVLANPESYLYACGIVLITLFIIVNYLTGRYILRGTSSIGISLLFQIIPLINKNILERVIFLNPESLIIIVAPFFMAYLFVNIKTTERPTIKTIALYGIFSGFLIVTKYTCLPVIILVLFILDTNKQRLQYLATVIISFFIFIIPALPEFKLMYQWVWGLITHTGTYGRGESGIINPTEFVYHIKLLLWTDIAFTGIYSVICIGFAVTVIKLIKKTKNIPFKGAISGIWFSVTTLILMVAKHTEFHYLIFAECVFPFGLIVSYRVIAGSFENVFKGLGQHRVKILYLAFIGLILFMVIEKVRYYPKKYPETGAVNKLAEEHKDIPLVISLKNGLQCERKEPALYLGYMYAGPRIRKKYAAFLKQLYPNSYIYWYGDTTFTYWDTILPISQILHKNKKLLFYLNEYSDTANTNIVRRFCNWNNRIGDAPFNDEKVYEDKPTGQDIHLITVQ